MNNLNITDMFLHSLLPIGIMFAAERLFILRLSINPQKNAWVKEQFWLHPNFICRSRYFMGLVSVLIFHFISVKFAILWFGFWMISDLTDGSIARIFGLQSETGEVIDPLSDKLFYFPPLFYFIYHGWLEWLPVIIFFVIDFTGQALRSVSSTKAANLFGKTKTFLVVSTIALITLQEVYWQQRLIPLGEVLLYIICCLAFCSAAFRTIPNYWYANTLSLLNFSCGILGILALLANYPPILALGLVFLGQFLDMFDGRCAERWGSTPNGDLVDDLADFTNFGGTIACLVYFTNPEPLLGLALAFVYLGTVSYRLWRFTKEKRHANLGTGSVAQFKGLPSPAAALLVGSTIVMLHNMQLQGYWLVIQSITVILSAGLMVSNLPYVHLGRSLLPKIPKMLLVITYSLMLLLVLFNWQIKDYFWSVQVLFWISVVYAVLGAVDLPIFRLDLSPKNETR